MPRLQVFISSVQKELSDERMAMQILLSTDAFLQKHTVPRLFEYLPAPLHPDQKEYLALLESCNLCVVILGRAYGTPAEDTGLSPTHEEYRLAKRKKLPILVCIKGDNTVEREDRMRRFLDEVKADGYTYSRFKDLEELQTAVRDRLVEHIKTKYDIAPTVEDNRNAEQSIAAADLFERQMLDAVVWEKLDNNIAARMIAAAEEIDEEELRGDDLRDQLLDRGYLWWDAERKSFYATAAGILLLAEDPSRTFSHARVQADAYQGCERTARADDHEFLRGPLTAILDAAVRFVNRNTRHPLRVVGLRRVKVNEYPETALREALVNALAHRDYREAGEKVVLEVFHDRVMVSNPGLPVGGQKLSRIAAGRGRSRSRNPLLAQGLTWLEAMEDRGTGILRMNEAMVNHGLEHARFAADDGCVVVSLPGPGNDLERIRVPTDVDSGLTPAQDEVLNERQRRILAEVVATGSVKSGWCRDTFGVTYDTANRDLVGLADVGLLQRKGRGRASHYVLTTEEAAE